MVLRSGAVEEIRAGWSAEAPSRCRPFEVEDVVGMREPPEAVAVPVHAQEHEPEAGLPEVELPEVLNVEEHVTARRR